MKYTIGIDVGTSSLKGIVMNENGEVLFTSSSQYEVIIPEVGHSEQNPQDWVNAFEIVMDDLIKVFPGLKSSEVGMSFSGQMHSLVVLDENDEVIRPAILWNDVRTYKESEEINFNFGSEMKSITKNRSLEGFTLPKILWMKNNEPSNYDRIKTVLLPKDYLRFVITGLKHMDYSDAAGTLLLDVEKNVWSDEICSHYNIPRSILPKLVKSFEYVGDLTSKYSDRYGSIRVYAGGADNACAALASGIMDPSDGMISIGTSGVFLSAEKDIQNYDGVLHFFNHCIPNYYSMGVTLSAGSSLSWFKSVLKNEDSFDEMLKNIDNIKPGSDGLIFTPYIMGERTPHFNSEARGSFVGISAVHNQDHFLRSVLEGITYSLRNSYEIMNQQRNNNFTRIISVGGGAKNQEWLQIQADIFNTPIYTLSVEEGPALGAAMLAALGEGWYRSVEECIETCVSVNKAVDPIEENAKIYEDYYKIYNEIYTSQKQIYNMLTKKNND